MMRYVTRLPAAVVVLAAVTGLGAEALAETGAQTRDWIRFETIDRSALPIVRARLNGLEGHRFVLDVGFKDLVLDTMLVDGAGLELVSQNQTAEIDYYGYKEKVPVAYLQSLQIGDAEFKLVRTLLVEGDDGTGIGGIRSYGRIGRDVLERLRLTIHYPRRLLFLEPSPEGEVPAGSVRFETAGRFLLVPVRITTAEGVEDVHFVLDAGTSNTVLDRKWASKRGLGGKRAATAKVPLCEVGAFREEEMPVLLGEMRELPYQGSPVGVIGADVLTQLSVSYDFPRQLVWLTKVESASR